jgi:hypothetical protein
MDTTTTMDTTMTTTTTMNTTTITAIGRKVSGKATELL